MLALRSEYGITVADEQTPRPSLYLELDLLSSERAL